ncbi:cytochrome b [Candidatus Falkowbacteria bacterium]|nr:cytochrome b/b6 domain-containing protein [Bacteroidales bacterium]NCU35043.1 cytochrome b [Candidatus Falkowbacteria bacterium]
MSNTKLVLVYKGFERFWHWTQAFLIIFLAITGFEIHSSYSLFGFETAVSLHNKAAWALIILIIFAIFWHITSGEWRQYLPTTKNLKAQIEFYLTGVFRNAPHPTKKTVLSKLNPLQRLVYLGLKILVIPVMVLSGLAYMFYRYPQAGIIQSANMQDLEVIAIIHTFGAFVLVAFIITHLYLITTGHTVTSNLKAMVTGWEELEADENEPFTENEPIIETEPKI